VPDLIQPLMDDLAEWRKASSKAAKALVFPDENGEAWSKNYYGQWRSRSFNPAAPTGARVYDLRHGYASLLIREGVDLTEVADRMGHSPTMTTTHYAHVFKQHRKAKRVSMETLVKRARANIGQTSAGKRPETASMPKAA